MPADLVLPEGLNSGPSTPASGAAMGDMGSGEEARSKDEVKAVGAAEEIPLEGFSGASEESVDWWGLSLKAKIRWWDDHNKDSRLYFIYKMTLTKPYNALLLFVTVYSVFMDDLQYAAELPKSSDEAVVSIMWFCFGVFCYDIGICFVYDRHYRASVMIALDLVATASMPITILLMSGASDLALGRLARFIKLLRIIRQMRAVRLATASSQLAMDKALKERRDAAQAMATDTETSAETSGQGAEGGIEMQAKRLPAKRRKSVTSFFKPSSSSQQESSSSHRPGWKRRLSINTIDKLKQGIHQRNLSTEVNLDPGTLKSIEESQQRRSSNVGQMLINRTTTNIVFLVLCVVIGTQMLTYQQLNEGPQVGVEMLHESFSVFNASYDCFNTNIHPRRPFCSHHACCIEWNNLLEGYADSLGFDGNDYTYVLVKVNGVTFLDSPDSSLREFQTWTVKEGTQTKLTLDRSDEVTTVARWSLGETLLITLVLIVFPYTFSQDVLHLVIIPMELIYDRVRSIMINPFVRIGDGGGAESQSETYEIDMIKVALERLTKLLQVGLGHAAVDIISRHMESTSLSLLGSGKKVTAIFGFCDIRSFTNCTEVLQEECILFVNSIAAIVSDECTRSLGAINKNIGDAFLMVWKWKDQESKTLEGGMGSEKFYSLPINDTSDEAADLAVVACSAMARRIKENPAIQAFADVRAMRERMGKDFVISAGFGLHMGWAIEGAIGSELKIDATYLSPHTKMCDALEGMTRPYNCDVLMSHWFHDLLSADVKQSCRVIDVVNMSGSPDPVTLYTYEDSHIISDPVRKCIDSKLYIKSYIKGDWPACRKFVDLFLESNPGDGPARAISNFIGSHDNTAPQDWPGHRPM